MTTGTTIIDDRFTVLTDCGNTKPGVYFRKSWSGADDPHHLAINPYLCEIVSVYDPLITFSFDETPEIVRNGTYSSCFGGIVAENVAFGANDELTLINRLGDQIRQHSFDAANSIGAEGKDALKQIAGTAGSLYKAGKALKHGDIPTAAAELGLPNPFKKGRHESEKQKQNNKLGKSLSNNVLAIQLGALPLMGDLRDAAVALDKLVNREQARTYVSKAVVKGIVYPASAPEGDVVCGEIRDSKRLVWRITYQPNDFEELSMANPWDLADLVWNFTALSFVADWAFPLQKFLSAQSTAYDFKGFGYVTHKRTVIGRTSHAPAGHKIHSGEYRYRSVYFTRDPVQQLVVPAPEFKPFKSIPSWSRALTAVGLLGQLVLK